MGEKDATFSLHMWTGGEEIADSRFKTADQRTRGKGSGEEIPDLRFEIRDCGRGPEMVGVKDVWVGY